MPPVPARELCLASVTLGWAAVAAVAMRGPDSAPPLPRSCLAEAALRTYVEAGLSYRHAIDQWAGEFDLLMEFAARMVDLGRRLPAPSGRVVRSRPESEVFAAWP